MKKILRILLFLFLIITSLYFGIVGLTEAKTFLAPIVIALLLAMLVLPLADKFESWGLQRGWAALFSDLLLIFATLVFVFVVSAQVKLVADDWDKIAKKLEPKIEKTLSFVDRNTGMNLEKTFSLSSIDKQISGKSKNSGEEENDQVNHDESGDSKTKKGNGIPLSNKQLLTGVASSAANLFSFLGNLSLVFIYVFFFLLYRDKLKKSFLKIVPEKQKDTASEIISKSIKVAKSYLSGKFILIVFLGIFYSVGMLLLGVKYAVFAGIIAAILSLIPYFGNLVGGGISVMFAFVSGGSIGIILGVVGVFILAQFIESYLLEPYIVGKQVELNPIIIIVMVILGQSIWGITGMVIAIPVTGIIKVFFDAIPLTRPLGYLLGNEDISGGESVFSKIERKVKSVFS